MKIFRITKNIKCDTVLCNKNADFKIDSMSYKGEIYLCEDCFHAIQKIFKKVQVKDGQK